MHGARAAQTTPVQPSQCAGPKRRITLRALCKDHGAKICAWTSSRKTVLTAASGAPHLSCNPKTGHDREPYTGRERRRLGVVDDEGAAQVGEWFRPFRSAVSPDPSLSAILWRPLRTRSRRQGID